MEGEFQVYKTSLCGSMKSDQDCCCVQLSLTYFVSQFQALKALILLEGWIFAE